MQSIGKGGLRPSLSAAGAVAGGLARLRPPKRRRDRDARRDARVPGPGCPSLPPSAVLPLLSAPSFLPDRSNGRGGGAPFSVEEALSPHVRGAAAGGLCLSVLPAPDVQAGVGVFPTGGGGQS